MSHVPAPWNKRELIRPCHLKRDPVVDYYLSAYRIWDVDPSQYPARDCRPQFIEAMFFIKECVRFYEREYSE